METCTKGFSFMPNQLIDAKPVDLQYVESAELENTWKRSRRERLKQQEQKIWDDFVNEKDVVSTVVHDDPYQFLEQLPADWLQARARRPVTPPPPPTESPPMTPVVTSHASSSSTNTQSASEEAAAQRCGGGDGDGDVFRYDEDVDGDASDCELEEEAPPPGPSLSPSPSLSATPSAAAHTTHQIGRGGTRAHIREELNALTRAVSARPPACAGTGAGGAAVQTRRAGEWRSRFHRLYLAPLQRQAMARGAATAGAGAGGGGALGTLLEALQIAARYAEGGVGVTDADALTDTLRALMSVARTLASDPETAACCVELERALERRGRGRETAQPTTAMVTVTNLALQRGESGETNNVKKPLNSNSGRKSASNTTCSARARLSMYSVEARCPGPSPAAARSRPRVRSRVFTPPTFTETHRNKKQPERKEAAEQTKLPKRKTSLRRRRRCDAGGVGSTRDLDVRTLVECASTRQSVEDSPRPTPSPRTPRTPRAPPHLPRAPPRSPSPQYQDNDEPAPVSCVTLHRNMTATATANVTAHTNANAKLQIDRIALKQMVFI